MLTITSVNHQKHYNHNSDNGVQKTKQGSISPLPDLLSHRKIALISGAGIAGLAASLVLKNRGFDVFITEKREDFTRPNLINLNMEVQCFLRKFNLLEEFETSVAARIKAHKYVVYGRNGPQALPDSDVSELNFDGSLPKNSEKFKDLFMSDGIYSVQIKDLQAFLAKKASELGVCILQQAKIKILDPIPKERVSKVKIVQKNSSNPTLVLEPNLFFIAEGAHSETVDKLGMGDEAKDVVENDCSGENWVFGNLKYSGDQTFVVSIIDTSQKTLQIANVIFNAKSHVVNVAVTSQENPDEDCINNLIRSTAQKAFDFEGIPEEPEILNKVKKPVHITNRMAFNCSSENIFRIGDAVGNSSPLAGLGGTLGLTLVPCTIKQLLKDYQMDSDELHRTFKQFSQAYVTKWINKSQSVKGHILEIFEKARISKESHELS